MPKPFVNQHRDDKLQSGYFQQHSARLHVAKVDGSISKDRFPPRLCDFTSYAYLVYIFKHF